jgi:flagellar basal body-associated protein FliL
MAEEQEQEGTMSGLKKTIIGTLGTVVTAGGVWVASLLGGGEEAAPVQQAAPVINITNSNQQTQQQSAGKTVIIERGGDKSSETKHSEPAKPAVKKKEADEFKEKPAQW